MIQFRDKLADKSYIERPGAYGIVINDLGELGVLRVKGEYFLPGGGLDQGESSEEALKRECLEEAGWQIEIVRGVGQAAEYDFSQAANQYLNLVGDFYVIKVISQLRAGTEADHDLVWLKPEEVFLKMPRQSQIHMVRQVLNLHLSPQ